jgi:hypothetical protein
MQHGSSGLANCNGGYLTRDGVFMQCISDPVTTMHSLNTMHEHVGKVPSGNFKRARTHSA